MNAKPNAEACIEETIARHQCLVYEGAPSEQLPALAVMLKRKMDEGFRCLYLNSRPMVAGIRSVLASKGVDVEEEISKGRLILSSEPVATGEGAFNISEMLNSLEDTLDQALLDGYKGLWATGDMTWEFGSEKNFAKLQEYEFALDDLLRRRKELGGICQYHRETLPREAEAIAFKTHPMTFVNETLSYVNQSYAAAKSEV